MPNMSNMPSMSDMPDMSDMPSMSDMSDMFSMSNMPCMSDMLSMSDIPCMSDMLRHARHAEQAYACLTAGYVKPANTHWSCLPYETCYTCKHV